LKEDKKEECLISFNIESTTIIKIVRKKNVTLLDRFKEDFGFGKEFLGREKKVLNKHFF
jgi:hypothetical protein